MSEVIGELTRLREEMSHLRKEVYERSISITMCAESALAVWEKDASDKELKALLDSIKWKSEFLRGYTK